MKIGVPKEIKNHEYRVGLTPASVREFVAHGHSVMVQTGAGAAIGLDDAQYKAAGATLADGAQEVFAKSDMIVKVKEPQPQECAMLRTGQLLYTYLHLAPDPEQTAALVKSGAVCVAYETITGANGGLPLARVAQQHLAGLGHAQRTRAHHQQLPHLRLERAQPLRHRRLRDRQQLRRTLEAARLGQRGQRLERGRIEQVHK